MCIEMSDNIIINLYFTYLTWFKPYVWFLVSHKIITILIFWLIIWIFARWDEDNVEDTFYTDSLGDMELSVSIISFFLACIIFLLFLVIPFILPFIIFVCIANIIINFIIERL